MKSSFTRTGKRSIAGMIDDGKKSLTRLYVNTLKDDDRQEAIDQFLGNIEDQVNEEDMTDEERWYLLLSSLLSLPSGPFSPGRDLFQGELIGQVLTGPQSARCILPRLAPFMSFSIYLQ